MADLRVGTECSTSSTRPKGTENEGWGDIGKPGKFGPILMRVCGPCKRGQSGVIKLKSGYAARLATSDQWVTLITEKYPNGVVRGQVKVG